MRSLFHALLMMLAVTVGSAPSSIAGFDEGVAAYDRGDFRVALREFRVSAARGDARAQNNIAVMYQTGRGVPQNYQEADRWYRNAAELGHVDAQFSLGLMYKEGLIGKMYIKGQGLVRNYVKAHKWFNIAASSGHTVSKENVGIVEGQMISEDIAKAKLLAQKWLRTWPIIFRGLDYSQQKSFEKSMVRACFKKQKSIATNSGFEDWQIEEYCDCSARYVSSKVQVSDVVYTTSNLNHNQHSKDILEIAAQKCSKELIRKWEGK